MVLLNRTRYAIAIAVAVIFVLIVFIMETNLMYHEQTLDERIANYNSSRKEVLAHERYQQVGGKVILNRREQLVNNLIRAKKLIEYEDGFHYPDHFKPWKHFFEAIGDTQLFGLLRSMPKGGVLHAHDMALCATDYLLQLSYRDSLWVCCDANGTYQEVRFAYERPNDVGCGGWELLARLRDTEGAHVVDEKLRQRLSLYPREHFTDTNAVWQAFDSLFRFVNGLLTYVSVWSDYLEHALAEFYADGVQYLEVRSSMPILYDMEGNYFTIRDTAYIMQEVAAMFKADHGNFIGLKVIYAPSRNVNDSVFDTYIDNAFQLKYNFPELFAGFDLVGQEDTGRPLKDFAAKLLAVHGQIDFYFHAGETNWYGTTVDENLIDAVLLGSKRIGHGYALPKHPEILRQIKQSGIAVEVSPISNQVLQHINDFRNHPCAFLFAGGYPVVISSDDPSFWKATPLTHDYYIAFMGIASKNADLGLLKQLAWNSLFFSALEPKLKENALESFLAMWNAWIDDVVNGNNIILPELTTEDVD